jgi:hypothetical protein
MRGVSFIILLLIPAMIALGHDTYLFYVNYVETRGFSLDLLMKEFKFSSLGFIWTTYDEESYKTTVGSVDPETWSIIDYLLTFKLVFVCLGFTAVMCVLYFIVGLFGKGPFAIERAARVFHSSDSKDATSFRSGQTSKKFEYKRK